MTDVSISPAQCRAARALIQWGISRLAEAAGLSEATVNLFELERRQPHKNNLAAIRRALEDGGVEFIPENGGGEGVRFRQRRADRDPSAGMG